MSFQASLRLILFLTALQGSPAVVASIEGGRPSWRGQNTAYPLMALAIFCGLQKFSQADGFQSFLSRVIIPEYLQNSAHPVHRADPEELTKSLRELATQQHLVNRTYRLSSDLPGTIAEITRILIKEELLLGSSFPKSSIFRKCLPPVAVNVLGAAIIDLFLDGGILPPAPSTIETSGDLSILAVRLLLMFGFSLGTGLSSVSLLKKNPIHQYELRKWNQTTATILGQFTELLNNLKQEALRPSNTSSVTGSSQWVLAQIEFRGAVPQFHSLYGKNSEVFALTEADRQTMISSLSPGKAQTMVLKLILWREKILDPFNMTYQITIRNQSPN